MVKGWTKKNTKRCEICGHNRSGVKFLKTYNGQFVSACEPCRIDMGWTYQIMKLSRPKIDESLKSVL